MKRDGSEELALYLHVPFCAAKCSYCDFVSASDANDPVPEEGVMWGVRSGLADGSTLADAYVAAVPIFLQEFAARGLLAAVPSVYLGGGTPTMLGARLPQLLQSVLALASLQDGAEVTVEANPDSLTPELLDTTIKAGANRFSLGVQSFDDELLSDLGRCHTAQQASDAAKMLKESGVRFSVDLICGVPGLEEDVWRHSVAKAIASGAEHVSVYPLSVERGTLLYDRIASGVLPEIDDDLAAEQMVIAAGLLQAAGLNRYEVASYARSGCEARHNVGYWTGVPYLGVGPSAASMMPVTLAKKTPMDHYVRTWPDDWRARFVVNDTLESFLSYLWDRQPAELEPITSEQAVREDAMLGLRMVDGIEDSLAEKAAILERLSKLESAGLVEHADGRWRTTQRGWLLGNDVFSEVWLGE
jgi:oxygen-independent coproporphyrinogen-3 oxidase